nr:MAG TPA: hypothetical protein [Caudoviricetes sp.]
MNYNTPKLNQETNDKWAQFDTLSDHLRGHCKHQTEESMTEYKKHIGQYEPSPYNDMMIDTPSPEELLSERNSAALGDTVQSFAIPRAAIKGDKPEQEAAERVRGRVVEPHEDFEQPEVQAPMFEMQEVVDGLPESELQTYKDQMLAEISDREAIVDAINRRLDTVQAKQYTGGVRNAITKQVRM